MSHPFTFRRPGSRKQVKSSQQAYYEGRPVDFPIVIWPTLKKLEAWEKENPEGKLPNSPTLRVGSDLNDDFAKVTHTVPMLSISNTYNAEELTEFGSQVQKGLEISSLDWVAVRNWWDQPLHHL